MLLLITKEPPKRFFSRELEPVKEEGLMVTEFAPPWPLTKDTSGPHAARVIQRWQISAVTRLLDIRSCF